MVLKYSIYDPNFSDQKNKGIGAQYVKWILDANGVHESSIEQSDIILISSVATGHYPKIERLRKKYPSKKIILGGHAALSPAIFINICDYIVCGDGTEFLEKMIEADLIPDLENVIYKGKLKKLK